MVIPFCSLHSFLFFFFFLFVPFFQAKNILFTRLHHLIAQKRNGFRQTGSSICIENYRNFFLAILLENQNEENCRHISFNMYGYLGILEIWNYFLGEWWKGRMCATYAHSKWIMIFNNNQIKRKRKNDIHTIIVVKNALFGLMPGISACNS